MELSHHRARAELVDAELSPYRLRASDRPPVLCNAVLFVGDDSRLVILDTGEEVPRDIDCEWDLAEWNQTKPESAYEPPKDNKMTTSQTINEMLWKVACA